MDISCFKDSKKNIGYCKFCKQSFCSKCNNDHKKHEFMYFDDFIEQLTKESSNGDMRYALNNAQSCVVGFEEINEENIYKIVELQCLDSKTTNKLLHFPLIK